MNAAIGDAALARARTRRMRLVRLLTLALAATPGGANAVFVPHETLESLQRPSSARTLLPGPIVSLSPSQPFAIVVDVAEPRLYLIEHQERGARVLESYYVSSGRNGPVKQREGDQRTPLGVYFLTGRIAAEHLPERYGPGALPVNYPNAWDRRLGRTGYGIWIHGSPGAVSDRQPRATRGCLTLGGRDLLALWSRLGSSGTPVIIGHDIDWVPSTLLAKRAARYARHVDRWADSWNSAAIEAFADHYSRTFRDDDMGYEAWLERKRVARSDSDGGPVVLSDLSLFAYPGEQRMFVATFDLRRPASADPSGTRTRQYWRREADGAWRIVYEGTVGVRAVHARGIPTSARAEFLSPEFEILL